MHHCRLNRAVIVKVDKAGELIGCPCLELLANGNHHYDGRLRCGVVEKNNGICPQLKKNLPARAS